MKKIGSVLIVAFSFFTFLSQAQLKYPKTEARDSTYEKFGTVVEDPYKWLEDDRSAETEAWVIAQNEFTFDYLDGVKSRDKIKERLSKLWDYEKLGAPFIKGGVKYYYKNDGLQNQYVIYSEKKGGTKVFLDPNKFSEDGTVSLGGMKFSKNGKIVAYSISEGGSDWRKVIVMDATNGEILEDTLVDVKFSGISWIGNEGFYYSSYDKPKGSELSAKTDQHKLYYHKLGTPQSTDELIFGGTEEQKRRYVSGQVTKDDRYLFIAAQTSTSGNELYIVDLKSKSREIKTIIDDFESTTWLIDNVGSTLFFVTNREAPNQKVITVDASNPSPENWVDLIPETENVMEPSVGCGYIFVHYMKDAISQIKQFDYKGELIREVDLPGIGTAGGFSAEKKDKKLYYYFLNYHTPSSIFTFDPKNGKSEVYWSPKIEFNAEDYESKQVFYSSKDGTQIPMIITYKKGTELNGKNPTILYGYGGFNVSLTPSFSVINAVWMEMGGIYAVANLRGGGEYGRKWHDAGTQMKKQNVFDDFIAAAEFLISEKYTSSDYLAVKGGSNGGLLVGAVMTQRPDLMKVALPAVGVLDMLRYHTFTAGAGWAYDYGTADDSKEMFEYLANYSPVHNVRGGVEYPATMVTTGDHDDRVVPAHSFKFIAELQAKQEGANPVLIRIETNAGHGAGTPVSKTIDAAADMMSFVLFNMGVEL